MKYYTGIITYDSIPVTTTGAKYSNALPIPDGAARVVQVIEKHLVVSGQLDSSAIQISLDGTNYADAVVNSTAVTSSGQRVLQFELPVGATVRWRGTYSGTVSWGTLLTWAMAS